MAYSQDKHIPSYILIATAVRKPCLASDMIHSICFPLIAYLLHFMLSASQIGGSHYQIVSGIPILDQFPLHRQRKWKLQKHQVVSLSRTSTYFRACDGNTSYLLSLFSGLHQILCFSVWREVPLPCLLEESFQHVFFTS